MVEYHIGTTSVSLELQILSGGSTVTGQSPWAEIRDKSTNLYYDFASRTFTGTTVSSTAPLTSAIDGLYRATWDISGLFTTNTFLTVEYHNATALSIDDVSIFRPPITTADVTLSYAGAGEVVVKGGGLDADTKRKLFKELKTIKDDIELARQQIYGGILELLKREVIKIEDIDNIANLIEGKEDMWQELKKPIIQMLNLSNSASIQDVIEKLKEYQEMEDGARKEVLEHMTSLIEKSKDVAQDYQDIKDLEALKEEELEDEDDE